MNVREPDTFTLTLRAEPCHGMAPPINRLKAALKRFRRQYHLVCTTCFPSPKPRKDPDEP